MAFLSGVARTQIKILSTGHRARGSLASDGSRSFGGFTAAGIGGSPSGNASLVPQTAWNFDLAWEWYFAEAGSLTVTGFYKSVNDYINFQPTLLEAEGIGMPGLTS